MIDVSIIYVNYNTKNLTTNSIRSIYNFNGTSIKEIIVVDNDSKDGSVALIRELFPEVIVIQNKKNIGFGRANNQGMEIAKGKYIFLLNTDTYLLNDAIDILFHFMENRRNKDVGVVGAKLYKEDMSFCVSSGPFPNFSAFIKGSFWKHFFPKSYLKKKTIVRNVDKNYPYEVDYVSGADFFVRKEIIDVVGGFDKRFFMYSEETELTFRIKNIFPTYSAMIVPKAKIVHIGQGSDNKGVTSRKFRYQRIKSKAIYFGITVGWFARWIYFVTEIKRLYCNRP